jgi:hypothetical protein
VVVEGAAVVVVEGAAVVVVEGAAGGVELAGSEVSPLESPIAQPPIARRTQRARGVARGRIGRGSRRE